MDVTFILYHPAGIGDKMRILDIVPGSNYVPYFAYWESKGISELSQDKNGTYTYSYWARDFV